MVEMNGKNGVNIILRLSNKIKLKIEEQISRCLDKEEAEILKGIILGETANIGEDVIEQFRNVSISHILAVSRITCYIYYYGT